MTTLEERLQRLEDIEAIRALKVRYAAACDAGYNPELIGPLFTEDAVWDAGTFGRYEGRKAIKEFFAGASSAIPFALHYTLGHQIDVDPSGKRAHGTWYIFMPGTMKDKSGKDQAIWLAGTYADEYVKVDGRWYFQTVNGQIRFMTPYEQGWVKKPFID